MADIAFTTTGIKTVDASAVTRLMTATTTIAAGDLVYESASGSATPAQATSSAAATIVGYALNGAAVGQPVLVLTSGQLTCNGLTKGVAYVLSAGAAGKTAPFADLVTNNWITYAGVAISTTILQVKPIITGVQV